MCSNMRKFFTKKVENNKKKIPSRSIDDVFTGVTCILVRHICFADFSFKKFQLIKAVAFTQAHKFFNIILCSVEEFKLADNMIICKNNSPKRKIGVFFFLSVFLWAKDEGTLRMRMSVE